MSDMVRASLSDLSGYLEKGQCQKQPDESQSPGQGLDDFNMTTVFRTVPAIK